MKPKRAKGWACGGCGKLYRDDQRERAEQCCVCKTCKSAMAVYIGSATCECRECARAGDVKNAKEDLERAKARLAALGQAT